MITMPIRHAIWKLGTKPEPLPEFSLGKEGLVQRGEPRSRMRGIMPSVSHDILHE
jgi:hypothetical protein